MPKSKLPPMQFFCPPCDKYAVPDPDKSTPGFDVLPPRCPDCGRKWQLEWGENK